MNKEPFAVEKIEKQFSVDFQNEDNGLGK